MSDEEKGCGCGAIVLIVIIYNFWATIWLVIKWTFGITALAFLAAVTIPVAVAAVWGCGYGIYNYFRALGQEMSLERPWVKGP